MIKVNKRGDVFVMAQVWETVIETLAEAFIVSPCEDNSIQPRIFLDLQFLGFLAATYRQPTD